MINFPNCKINLGLRILRKRTDGFHELETVFYPIPLRDGLEIIQNEPTAEPVVFTSSGRKIDVSAQDNICVKAYHLLKKDHPQMAPVKMHLHKIIPAGAGLGGGSADGAFTLLLLNKKFRLSLGEEQLRAYALTLGSDCPFFVLNQPAIARGRGEELQTLDLDLSAFRIVLVNPGIHIPTGWAFSQISPFPREGSLEEIVKLPVTEWKQVLKNDFEPPVFGAHAEIGRIRDQLYESGAVYASMSGTGSTVYGLFDKEVIPSLNFPSHYFMKSV